jgi:hypothetical protein
MQLVEHGVNRADALRLASAFPGECRRQLGFLPFVSEFKRGKGAYLRSAIEQGFGPPAGWEEAERRKAEEGKRAAAAAADAGRAEREKRCADERAGAVRELRERLESGDRERWAALVAEAEAGMAPPVRSRPHSAAYAAAVNAAVARLLPPGGGAA